MRRTPLTRTLSSLLIALYLALPGGVLASRACPHHDGAASQHPVRDDGHASHGTSADLSGEALQAQHDAHAAATTSPDTDSGECETCTCFGACAASSAVVVAAIVLTQLSARDVSTTTVDAPATELPRPRFEPFLLPYANAPPQQSIG
jgi:hypothetical protein